MKNKKIISFITFLFIVFEIIPVFGITTNNQHSISLSAEALNNGNFFSGDQIQFRLGIKNNTTARLNTKLQTTLYDENGFVVHNEEKELQIKGLWHFLTYVTFEAPKKFGTYTVKFTVKTDAEAFSCEREFSYINKAETSDDKFGFSTHFSKANEISRNAEKASEAMPLIEGCGAGWIRDDCPWSLVESTKKISDGGSYKIPSYIEDAVNSAYENDVEVMLILSGGNFLYEYELDESDNKTAIMPKSSEAIDAFASYCAFVAEHFKNKVTTFEIWNEPDSYYTANDYYPVLKASYNAIKGVYQGEEDKVTVVAGAITPWGFNFLESLLKIDDANNFIDCLSMHPYGTQANFADDTTAGFTVFVSQLEKMKKLTNKPIILSEYGASSFGNSENSGLDGASPFTGYGIYGNNGQVSALIRASLITRCDPQIKRMFVYTFKEKDKHLFSGVESEFGILKTDYYAKPAYVGISFMNHILSETQPLEPIEAKTQNYNSASAIYSYCFENSAGDIIYVVGKKDAAETDISVRQSYNASLNYVSFDTQNRTLIIQGKDTIIYDFRGNDISDEDTVILDIEPLYIVFPAERQTEIIEDNNSITINGFSEKPNSTVTVLVTQTNVIGKKISYIEQLKTDNCGKYSVNFIKSLNDIYTISVYDGKNSTMDAGNSDFDIDLKIYANNTEISNIDDIKPNMIVRAVMNIKSKTHTSEKLTAYAIVKNKENIIFDCDSMQQDVGDSNVTLSAEVKIDEQTDIDTLKFMLWKDNMQPVINSIKTVRQQGGL